MDNISKFNQKTRRNWCVCISDSHGTTQPLIHSLTSLTYISLYIQISEDDDPAGHVTDPIRDPAHHVSESCPPPQITDHISPVSHISIMSFLGLWSSFSRALHYIVHVMRIFDQLIRPCAVYSHYLGLNSILRILTSILHFSATRDLVAQW